MNETAAGPGTRTKTVAVLGASGYVGGRLVPRLIEAGYKVRCLARSPEKLAGLAWSADAEVVQGDLMDTATIDGFFDGVDAIYHLVHSMGSDTSFADADRQIAHTVADGAAAAGVDRIMYLSGLGEIDTTSSAHLRSRDEVATILAEGPVPVTTLRAAVIIGSGSASFEMLRHLVEKLPVMITPRWVRTRVQPIAIRDVLRYLIAVLSLDDGNDHVFDIGGPDVLTYLDMMRQFAEVAGLRRRMVIQVPVLTPKLSSHWVGFVTPVPPGLAKPLVHSLTQEVIVRPNGEDITQLAPGPTIPYARALELALGRIRDHHVETSWRDAELTDRSPAEPYPGDPAWTGGTLLQDRKVATTRASANDVFATVCGIGGQRGWPTHAWAWALRGWLDQLIGGVGLRRGRRDPDALRVGDALDFWRVEEVRPPRADDDPAASQGVLRLRAEMKVPGHAWLEFRVVPEQGSAATRDPAHGTATLHQRALFAPKGLPGRAYWWAMLPFHAFIFSAMVRTLAEQAERLTNSGEQTKRRGHPGEVPSGAALDTPHGRSA